MKDQYAMVKSTKDGLFTIKVVSDMFNPEIEGDREIPTETLEEFCDILEDLSSSLRAGMAEEDGEPGATIIEG